MANVEKVWKAEQKALAEKRKIDELLKERDAQRAIEDLQGLL
jgi:hypothetical protein